MWLQVSFAVASPHASLLLTATGGAGTVATSTLPCGPAPLHQTSASQPLLPMANAATIAELESTVASLQATVTSLVQTVSNATAAANTSRIDTAEDISNLKGSIDTFYLLYSGTLVFFMQARAPVALWRIAPTPQLTTPASRPGRLGSVCSRRGRCE